MDLETLEARFDNPRGKMQREANTKRRRERFEAAEASLPPHKRLRNRTDLDVVMEPPAKAHKNSSHRSRSPRIDRHRHTQHRRKRSPVPKAAVLPLNAQPLSKDDYFNYQPMFALYLDIQKHLVLEDLSETEVRGRWKSFVGKWNRGELAEGWYDTITLRKAVDSATKPQFSKTAEGHRRASPIYNDTPLEEIGKPESSDDDAVGPALPDQDLKSNSKTGRHGPAIPNMQDLELQREIMRDDSITARDSLRIHRAVERKEEKARLEELAPRAEPGSKERMLEKKREKADTNRAFASAKTDAEDIAEVPESDLLGDDDVGIEGFKKQKKEMDRKKNDRELRREEVLRARAVERQERVQQYRQREEATMKGLVEMARARFG